MRLSVVCYLDSESTAAVRKIQEQLGKLTGARASLDLWQPHITVGDGIEVDDNELSTLKARLSTLTANTSPFAVELAGIIKMDSRQGGEGEETTPYGLYLNVKPNEDLWELVIQVAHATNDMRKWYRMPQPYHPHCALAFKDLSKEGYKIGIDYLDTLDLQLQTSITHIALVEMLPNQTQELVRFVFQQ